MSCGRYLCWYGSNYCKSNLSFGRCFLIKLVIFDSPPLLVGTLSNKMPPPGWLLFTPLFCRALRGILWTLGVRVETQDSVSPQVRVTSTARKCNSTFLFPEPSQFATMCPSPSALRSGRRTTPPARGSDDQLFSSSSNINISKSRFKYKVVTDNCEHAFWEECEDQTKKVPFHVSKIFSFSPPPDAFTYCSASATPCERKLVLPFSLPSLSPSRQWSRSAGRRRRSGTRSARRSPSRSTWCAGLAW